MDASVGALYDQIGGFDTVLNLCRRWHALCLMDPVAAHPFEHLLHPQHEERLAAYLAEAFGGPALYSAGYGDETHVQRIHAGNGVHLELDEACLARFDQALNEVGIVELPLSEFLLIFDPPPLLKEPGPMIAPQFHAGYPLGSPNVVLTEIKLASRDAPSIAPTIVHIV